MSRDDSHDGVNVAKSVLVFKICVPIYKTKKSPNNKIAQEKRNPKAIQGKESERKELEEIREGYMKTRKRE